MSVLHDSERAYAREIARRIAYEACRYAESVTREDFPEANSAWSRLADDFHTFQTLMSRVRRQSENTTEPKE